MIYVLPPLIDNKPFLLLYFIFSDTFQHQLNSGTYTTKKKKVNDGTKPKLISYCCCVIPTHLVWSLLTHHLAGLLLM